MATKPNEFPEWASDPNADAQAPPVGKKEQGWAPLEKPPHQWFNWLGRLTYLWLEWLDSWTSGHNHRGDGGDGSSPKVDLKDEIKYAGASYLQSTTVSGASVLEYKSDDDAIIRADVIVGANSMRSPVVTASNHLNANDVRPITGGTVYIGSQSVPRDLSARKLRATIEVSAPKFTSPNVPKAIIKFTGSAQGGVATNGTPFNATVSDSPGTGNGIYTVTFTSGSPASANGLMLIATSGSASSIVTATAIVGGATVIVRDTDGNSVTNAAITLVAYWS